MTKKFKVERGRNSQGRLSNRNQSDFRLKHRVYKAREWAIYECVINPSWKENGLANILISRKQPDGLLIIGSYLVDTLCLGLKDTFCKVNYTAEKYETHKTKMYRDEEPFNCDISFAHTIIYGGIDFAATFGIKPQKDFKLSKYILIEPNKIEIDKSIEFGKDGKPLYIQGPYDDPEIIMNILKKTDSEG